MTMTTFERHSTFTYHVAIHIQVWWVSHAFNIRLDSSRTTTSLYRYCIFCPPLFSSFFCLLLSLVSVPSALPASCFPIPAIPFLIPNSTVLAIHIEYIGTAAYIYHAPFPNKAAAAIHAHVQYSTSHINSVNPLASRSSPDFLSSPFSAYFGRPIVSNQYSIPNAGIEKRT